MSFLEKMREAARQADERPIDPWEPRLRRALQNVQAMSTFAILDLIEAEPSTSNGRRLAGLMRHMGFVAIKSRRLLPGGRVGNTVVRGWCRPFRGTAPLLPPERRSRLNLER
jgi:hypothetical protein